MLLCDDVHSVQLVHVWWTVHRDVNLGSECVSAGCVRRSGDQTGVVCSGQ